MCQNKQYKNIINRAPTELRNEVQSYAILGIGMLYSVATHTTCVSQYNRSQGNPTQFYVLLKQIPNCVADMLLR